VIREGGVAAARAAAAATLPENRSSGTEGAGQILTVAGSIRAVAESPSGACLAGHPSGETPAAAAAAESTCVEINQCVGCTRKFFTIHFSAMTWPRWFRRAVMNRHRHAIDQASRRWRGERRGYSGRTRRKFDFRTGIDPIGGGTPKGGRGGYPSGGRGIEPGAPMSASGGATPGLCPNRPTGARPAVNAPRDPIAIPGGIMPMPLFCS
jgi:hypothetical protein